MQHLFYKDIIGEIIPYLDLQSAYNFLSFFQEFTKEKNLIKKILDDFYHFIKNVHDDKIYDDLLHWDTDIIIYNPSELLLDALKTTDYHVCPSMLKYELNNNSDFKFISPWETWTSIMYNDTLPEKCKDNLIIFKKEVSPYITIPFSVYLFYKKFNKNILFDIHIGIPLQDNINECPEFQDELPLYTYEMDEMFYLILTVNCNSKSKFYGKLGFLDRSLDNIGETDFSVIRINISLFDLINFSEETIHSFDSTDTTDNTCDNHFYDLLCDLFKIKPCMDRLLI